jgi:hypothetical protein
VATMKKMLESDICKLSTEVVKAFACQSDSLFSDPPRLLLYNARILDHMDKMYSSF